MKKMILPYFVVFTLLATIVTPQQGWAETTSNSTLQQAADELKEAEAKQKQAAKNLKEAQSQIKKIQAEKKKTKNDIYALEDDIDSLESQVKRLDLEVITLDNDIHALDSQINEINEQIEETNKELKSLENKSDQVEADLQQSKQLLQEAIERIGLRDTLIRERLRYMYTNGSVSYIDVLFGSTSFKDFLERFQFLTILVDHDHDILEQNRNDYEKVSLQITEVERQLASLFTLYDQQIAIKDQQTLVMDEQVAMKDQQVESKDRQLTAKQTQVAAKKKLESLMQSKNNQIVALSKEEEMLGIYTEEQEKELIAAAAIIAASNTSIVYYKGGTLKYPLPETFRVSSNFGLRTNPVTGKANTMHNGIDFAAPDGTDILAAESGIVVMAGWANGYGNVVILDHGDGLWTVYAHARPGGIKVEVGQTVARGDKISEVGTTGNSTGYHLHFEVRIDEKAVEPRDYLNL